MKGGGDSTPVKTDLSFDKCSFFNIIHPTLILYILQGEIYE